MIAVYIVIALIVGMLAGYAAATLFAHKRNSELRVELAALQAKTAALSGAREQMENTFKALAGDALRASSQSLLELAGQNLGKFQAEAKGDLEKRQQAFAELIKPIGDTLRKTEEQIGEIKKDHGNISRYLTSMQEAQTQLQSETRNLVNALRRPEVRGRWGEMTLRRLAELAGMVERCDFEEQVHTETEEGALRPDMVVHLAENRTLVVDAKTPLDSYIAALEASTPEERESHLAQHARKVRERIKELASKRYWDQFKSSPDFVILFIPGDQFLSAALDKEHELQEEALRQKVLLATPTSLMALLKVVAYGWRQIALAENAEQIRDLAATLHQRLAIFGEHLDQMGHALGKSVENYNKAVGSLERQVLPAARRFTELGVQSKKELPRLDPLDTAPRLDHNDKP
ncbi:MAG: DNA recombination protein RmuC [Gammaproteobacteria bacterium]|nr:DNA recombination protein RmuC [Gammaproteobacteria bacterium]MBU6508678.1 DNA recombination protein RmuC [Gammaproteobacteria bacterium]MDE1982967.1 DNA recombination protein RmuC [Gammaproteobacteria bacterium]MDE2107787.1 DNA recombination protein RmuC [Gammaproteobacteria bacterium]MDE2459701.1 DNA recombination protein RmuC [Gammaproteobacteria bacterium]